MEKYIVSARKYRPMTWGSVVGQEALTTTLRNAITSGRSAHAYLFCGTRGTGKTTTAHAIATKLYLDSDLNIVKSECGCLEYYRNKECVHSILLYALALLKIKPSGLKEICTLSTKTNFVVLLLS